LVKVIVCGYNCDKTISKCLDSIACQSEPHDLVVSTCTDTDRVYLLENTVAAIKKSGSFIDDVIVCVDADDFLCDECALEIVAERYSANKNLLLTYGSYVDMSTNKRGKFSGAYESGESFRTSQWRGSHLKTFKRKLWQAIPDKELRDEDGQYYKCCADRAMMIPMMEIARIENIEYISTLMYMYNDMNNNSVWKTMRDESLRIRKRICSGSEVS